MLTNRQVILLKIEGTYKTDPTPTAAADAILVENLTVAENGLRMVERPAIEQNIGTRQGLYAGTLYDITFDMEIKGSGAAGTAPECGQALQAVGFGEFMPVTLNAVQNQALGAEHEVSHHNGRSRCH